MRKIFIQSLALSAIAYIAGVESSLAAVKLLGGFEGTMASPYTTAEPLPPTDIGGCGQDAGTINWCADAGITVAPEFIDLNDPLDEPYWGAVTEGQQALLHTFPGEWGDVQGPYLRLHGQAQLMEDVRTSGFQFMAFDVTTFGGYDQPPEEPPMGTAPYRQVFTVFNTTVAGFYDANSDTDVQIDFPMAEWDAESFTTTVIQDLRGPAPMNGDGQIVTNLIADASNPTVEDFAFQIVLVFQGRDYPPPTTVGYQVQVAIDNVRLCDTAEECAAAPPVGLPGDFNGDDVVDAVDYTVWRNNLNTNFDLNGNGDETGASMNFVDGADYTLWKASYGDTAPGAGGLATAVPEPSSVLLAFLGLCGLAHWWRRAR
jgi:hypothetical protein